MNNRKFMNNEIYRITLTEESKQFIEEIQEDDYLILNKTQKTNKNAYQQNKSHDQPPNKDYQQYLEKNNFDNQSQENHLLKLLKKVMPEQINKSSRFNDSDCKFLPDLPKQKLNKFLQTSITKAKTTLQNSYISLLNTSRKDLDCIQKSPYKSTYVSQQDQFAKDNFLKEKSGQILFLENKFEHAVERFQKYQQQQCYLKKNIKNSLSQNKDQEFQIWNSIKELPNKLSLKNQFIEKSPLIKKQIELQLQSYLQQYIDLERNKEWLRCIGPNNFLKQQSPKQSTKENLVNSPGNLMQTLETFDLRGRPGDKEIKEENKKKAYLRKYMPDHLKSYLTNKMRQREELIQIDEEKLLK